MKNSRGKLEEVIKIEPAKIFREVYRENREISISKERKMIMDLISSHAKNGSIIVHDLSDEVKKELETNDYTVECELGRDGDVDKIEISWK